MTLDQLQKLCDGVTATGILKHWDDVEWLGMGYKDGGGFTLEDHEWLEAARKYLPLLLDIAASAKELFEEFYPIDVFSLGDEGQEPFLKVRQALDRLEQV